MWFIIIIIIIIWKNVHNYWQLLSYFKRLLLEKCVLLTIVCNIQIRFLTIIILELKIKKPIIIIM